MEIRTIIPSRGRSETIRTHHIFRKATLVVPDNEVETYEHTGLEIVPIPQGLIGISRVRNWILKKFSEEVLVMLDDDIIRVVSLTGVRRRYLSRREAGELLEVTAIAAKDVGAWAFGWNQAWDVRKYQGNEPFKVATWLGGALGVIGRKVKWDEHLRVRCDIDFSLENLLRNRIVWTDQRFSFEQMRELNTGGAATFRTAEMVAEDKAYLKKKWKSHLSFQMGKTTERTLVRVQRKGRIL